MTGLVKAILPLHVQQRLKNAVVSWPSANAANNSFRYIYIYICMYVQTGIKGSDFINLKNSYVSCQGRTGPPGLPGKRGPTGWSGPSGAKVSKS